MNVLLGEIESPFSNNKISTYSAFVATKEKLIPCEVRELPKGNGLPLLR
ncbi:hypothetical protein EV02_1649 [Prochlorococcus marinus str. SB]|uniref:Uncharacterized protein n=1 Tax=Prochlorococcus marinus str. SB TaxID=59926 RepID=A0A0A2B544_PROMR|nr:hypothetical protein EV02_1649 [Prochlorococcus marinus str. SB]